MKLNSYLNTIASACFVFTSFTVLGQAQEVPAITIGKSPVPSTQVSDAPKLEATEESSASFTSSYIKVVDKRDSLEYNIIKVSDEVIAQRLASLENIMPMPYNEHVKKYIDYFLYKRPSFVREMLERSERYFPVFEEYLVKHNMPDEMKYLALLESGLNPKAVSHAKAVGMWQFMSYTGKEMGLTINSYLDERMDVEKATDASFRYLTRLYNRFNDWELALAAYNTGPGRINRAIRRSGKTDYWSLHRYIHRDTRAYVPQWAALNYLMNYAAEHGIFPDPEKTQYPIATESLLINGYLNLKTFAELNYLSLEELKDVNPHITKEEIPSYAKNVLINFPSVRYAYFDSNKVCILDSAAKLPPAKILEEDGRPYHIEYVNTKTYYRVRRGDNLDKIARNYGVSISNIKKWNNLRSSKILTGQRLAIYVKKANKVFHEVQSVEKVENELLASNTANKTETQKPTQKTSAPQLVANTSTTANAAPKVTYEKKTVQKIHRVSRGETLISIAQKHRVYVSQLKRWNHISNANNIKVGQRIKYYKTVTEKVYNSPIDGPLVEYTVQRGDTLWSIAQRHPGLSIEDIKKINNLSSNNVQVGQKLKVKKLQS